ncbi:aldo/keto reductase [uncultured Thomasclavelia sp.]|uniref:aldo/keto reductase n=2 Tax=Thomasclavelia TaxID=3025755 RepID=UPI00280B7B27|nr:aldo/keto reductase [uncultured Thomasclavelia sp.]
MRKQKLGKDLEVSAVGLGCMGMTHAYGKPANKEEMKKLIVQAVEQGCNFFDTAECYVAENEDGTIEYNEELVGEALAPYRDQVIIATKCGVHHQGTNLVMDARPETIKKAIEGSLKRLKTDYIDLYYLHRIDPNVPIETVAKTMKELMEAGKIRYWGISEADEDTIRRAHAICPLTAIQNRYSMMYRDYGTLFPVLEELNISLVAFSPLANGLLSDAYNKDVKFTDKDDFRTRMPQFTPEAYDANQELMEMIRTISKEKNCTPAQLSLAWMINKKPYIIPIPGTRKSNRLKENLESANVYLTEEEVAKIDSLLDKVPMSDLYGR